MDDLLLNQLKAYQLKDAVRQHSELNPSLKLKYKSLTKKYLIKLIKQNKINTGAYVLPVKNPVERIPTNVLKKYGLTHNTDDQQELLVEEMKSINPLESKTQNIKLQDHQEKFIKQFIFSQLRGAVVFHGVGSGKTLTAVVSSYFYLKVYPQNKVIVISPPALLYNFINSMVQYGLDIKDKRYTFTTYDKYIRKPTVANNSLLIIDEAHNFRTEIKQSEVKDPETNEALKSIIISNKKGALVQEFGAMKAHKILLLTGTPFVNSIYDIENLLSFIDKREPLDRSSFSNIISIESNLPEYFGHRISYFPTVYSEFFPTVNEQVVPIYMSKGDAKKYKEIKSEGRPNSNSENPNTFLSAERYASNALRGENNKKLQALLKLITDKPKQKFIVYTALQDGGIRLIKENLDKLKIGYVVISGSESTVKKEESRKYFNGYYNDKIPQSNDPLLSPYKNTQYRILLITKAGTEGVDTKNCQNMVLYDSQWNDATSEQIIARAVRYKSHIDLPVKERYVNVYRLLFVFPEDKIVIDRINVKGFDKWTEVKTQSRPAVDLHMYLLSKSKLEIINQFVSKFGGSIKLFEAYQNKLLPFIVKAEKKLKRKLTTHEQIKIYMDNLKDEVQKILDFNFIGKPKAFSRTNAEQLQQYFTSDILANYVIDNLKNVEFKNIKVLEPTAGSGQLIKPVVEKFKDNEFKIDLIELDEKNRKELSKLQTQAPNIINLLPNKNFLTFGTTEKYDLILMNPPFHIKKSENASIKDGDIYDFDFVNRAFSLLQVGGQLVGIIGKYYSVGRTKIRFDNLPMNKPEIAKIEIKERPQEVFISNETGKKHNPIDVVIIKITKLSQKEDSNILGTTFYKGQAQLAQKLERAEISLLQEEKIPEPKPPKPAKLTKSEITDLIKNIESFKLPKIKTKSYNKKVDKLFKKIQSKLTTNEGNKLINNIENKLKEATTNKGNQLIKSIEEKLKRRFSKLNQIKNI